MKTIIIVYEPSEDEATYNKDKFWEVLTLATEKAKGAIYIAGDFKSSVGKGDEKHKEVLGKYGEDVIRNNNGTRMLDFCILNNLIITNSFFEQKDINRFTREVNSIGERSIIDYTLYW